MYKFPVRFNECKRYDTIKYIFPTKQKVVAKIIDLARENEAINRIIVFGSAVTLKCGMSSDVDLAVVTKDKDTEEFMKFVNQLYQTIDDELDVIHYNRIKNNLLKKEIDGKGVSVYVKP